MTKIFISYRRDDSAHVVGRIRQNLIPPLGNFPSEDVFVDVDGIPLGANVRRYIDERVGQCAVMLVVIGREWLSITDKNGNRRLDAPNDYVRIEVETALRREIPIIPLLVDGVDMPTANLPASIIDLAEYNGTHIRRDPDFQIDMARLVQGLERWLVPAQTATKPTSISLMPAPFAWVEIPAGHGVMKTDLGTTLEIPSETYWMSKYPITNGQYGKFIKAGGYDQQKWWTAKGWGIRQENGWTTPRDWDDNDFNGAEQPVVGVSWFEAVAFCLWLSDITGEKIMLPTEAQWQYAAQGSDGRAYPWGNEWDAGRCNNRVDKVIGKTTPVTQYQGKGDSPFGVVDMAGNVNESCLVDYDSSNNNIDGDVAGVERGGSWDFNDSYFFRCGCRYSYNPLNRHADAGFRIALS